MSSNKKEETKEDSKKSNSEVDDTITIENDNVATTIESKNAILHEKIFKPADSYLTELLQNVHIQTLYNIFVVAAFYLLTYTICHDYFTEAKIYLGWRTIVPGFRGLPYALGCWFLLHFMALLVYFGVCLWTKTHTFGVKGAFPLCLNAAFLTLCITTLFLTFSLCALCTLHYQFRLGCGLALLMESTRLIMKMHAFVRSTIGRTADPTPTSNAPLNVADLSHYIYFLFAPVLVYRTSYPRNSTPIRWSFVGARIFEILFCCFYCTFFYEQFIGPYYRQFGATPLQWSYVIESFHGMILPSTMCLVIFIYMLLYSIQNLFAELMHFSDRRFYTNWWTATNCREFFIKWNCLVQDWLYEYVYKDCFNYVYSNRLFCSFTVITISAVMHEIIIGMSLQLFLPINYICFGIISFILMYIPLRGRIGNLILWLFILVGMSLQFCLYSMEFFAKVNCPKSLNSSLVEKLVPHIWTCIQIRN